jgi:serine/threonine protein kinase
MPVLHGVNACLAAHTHHNTLWFRPGGDYEGPPVDVWAAAVMLYELSIGLRPFLECPKGVEGANTIMQRAGDVKYIEKVLFSKSRLDKASPSPDLIDLLKKMFVVDPEKRITMEQVSSTFHEFTPNNRWFGRTVCSV